MSACDASASQGSPPKRLQAGGPTKYADKASVYLVKADGSVVSREQRGWFFN